MNKEEIIRICNYYNEKKSYTESFMKSKDLGLIEEIIPCIQENIPSLSASLKEAWIYELQILSRMSYLNQVTDKMPKVPVRMIAIKYNKKKGVTIFSLAFNLAMFARPGIKVQGISIISFGVDLSISDKGPSGKRKLAILKNISGTEKFIPLKKAS